METLPPYWIDVFISVIRDNQTAQVALMAVLLLILLDWVFGVANAIAKKEFSSQKMREGIGHKCSELGFCLVGVIIDGTLIGGVDLGYTAPCFTAICIYICLMEIGSLLEIFSRMNPAIADNPIMQLLKQNKALEHIEGEED